MNADVNAIVLPLFVEPPIVEQSRGQSKICGCLGDMPTKKIVKNDSLARSVMNRTIPLMRQELRWVLWRVHLVKIRKKIRGLDCLRFGGTDLALHSQRAAEMLASVSAERMREELEKMFQASTLYTLDLLSDYPQVMQAIFRPETGLRLSPTMKK